MNETMTAPAAPETITTQAPQTPDFNASDANERAAQFPFQPEFAIYKPNARGSGGVVRLRLSKENSCVFAHAANQSGERQFDWENKIIMKLGIPDLGAILAVLQARHPEAKLFHRTDKANTTLNLRHQNDPERAPYMLAIARQDAGDGSVRKSAVPLSHSEAAILETLLRTAIARILKW